MENNTWRELVDVEMVEYKTRTLLDTAEELNPLILDGGEIPEETRSHPAISLTALMDWVYEIFELGIINRPEYLNLRDELRAAHKKGI